MPLQDLEVLGTGPGADRQGQRVVELVYHQVEVDGLLPVNVGVADGQLAGVFPEHLQLRLWGGNIIALINNKNYLITTSKCKH